MSIKSKIEESRGFFKLTGNLLLIEKLPAQEIKTASGLVLATDRNHVNSIGANAPVFCRVVASGEGTYEDDGTEADLDTRPGAIILVGDVSVRWLSYMPVKNYKPFEAGITSESEIQIKWETEEDYNKWVESVSK